MRLADGWKEYRLLDASDGERLEAWGDITLIRPDPQVIWKTQRRHPDWQGAHARYLRSDSGGGRWEYAKKFPEQWQIGYKGLRFHVRPTGFKHTGLFPEQAVNWDLCAELIRAASRPVNVLNLFAYTGGATLACLSAGAGVCHVDAARGMVDWGKANAKLSALSDKPVRWIVDDCAKFVARELRRGNKYDGIIMDPPSYGRGPTGELWKLEDSIFDLVSSCAQLLSDDPLFFLINSYTTGLSPSVMAYLLHTTVGEKHRGAIISEEIGLPVEASGMALPCGSTAIWRQS